MKLSYLLLFGLLAFIVMRMSNAYTDMAKELKELRIKCMGPNDKAKSKADESTADVTLPLVNDIKKVSSVLQGFANRF